MTSTAERRLPSLVSLLKTQVQYQLKLFVRTPRLLVSAFLLPVLILWIRHTDNSGAGANAANLVALGAVSTFGVMSACFSTLSVRLVSARESGTLKRLRAAPLPPVIYFSAQIIASVVLAWLAVGVTVLFGRLEHIDLPAHAMPALLLAVTLGSITWAALGTGMSTLFHDVASAQGLLQAILLPLVFFSGVFFPTADEPHWLATFASWLPAEPFVDILSRSVQLTHGWLDFTVRDVALLVAWIVIGIVVAVRFFDWEPYRSSGYAKRKKTVSNE